MLRWAVALALVALTGPALAQSLTTRAVDIANVSFVNFETDYSGTCGDVGLSEADAAFCAEIAVETGWLVVPTAGSNSDGLRCSPDGCDMSGTDLTA